MSALKGTSNDFRLEDVLELGGVKADFELLAQLNEEEVDKEVVVSGVEDLDSEPIKRDDVLEFIKKLGFDQFKHNAQDESDKKQKKVKLVSMPGTEDEVDNDKTTGPPIQKGKKSKNKYKTQDTELSSTSTVPKPAAKPKVKVQDYLSQYETRKHLLVKAAGKWYDQFPSQPVTSVVLAESKVKKLEQFAVRLMTDDVALFNKQKESRKRSETAWMKTVLSSGTLTDKIAALTILVQEDPVHNLAALDTFVAMAKKKGHREALMALNTLRELFLSDLLPDDRKLKSFDQNPLSKVDEISGGNKDTRDRHLLVWYFEHQLKERYSSFVQAVETLSHDTLPAARQKALAAIYEMVAGKPEQEKVLLSSLVNKLGDPDYKVASKAVHFLGKLVEKHPNMKLVIVQEVERLLYRPNISAKAQYYAICFLNQLILSHSEQQLAARLISVYFSFFKASVKNGEVDHDGKMLSALLSGVNRAYPFAKLEPEKLNDQMDTLYKTVHIVNFNTSVQTLMLLYQVSDAGDSSCDRYYTALYKKMLDPELRTSAKQSMFLNLLFKSMKKDMSNKRVQAIMKRLLQICCQQSPSFICGALILLSELLKVKPDLLSTTKTAEESDDEEEHFRDIPSNDQFESGENEALGNHISDSDHKAGTVNSNPDRQQITTSSWVHRQNLSDHSEGGSYDPHQRNPLYCGADKECDYELKKLAHHYHPSVALFAENILKGLSISYPGDPLQDFTLIRFLDRFVYRNPKKNLKDSLPGGNSNLLQSRNKMGGPTGIKGIAVNSAEYLETGEESIPADEKFFYKYFSQQALKTKKKEAEDFDSDAGSISDDEFDDFLDKYETDLVQEGTAEIKFDFAGEFSNYKTKKRSKKEDSDEDDEEAEELNDDLSDEEVDFGDDDDFAAAFESDEDGEEKSDEFDEEAVAFSDEDVELDFAGNSEKGKGKRAVEDEFSSSVNPKRQKQWKDDPAGLFAAAEEFSHMMDENTGSQLNMIGTEAMSNKDNASVKQLKWEADRERWMHGKDWRAKKHSKIGKFKGNGPRGKQRKGANKLTSRPKLPPRHKGKGKK